MGDNRDKDRSDSDMESMSALQEKERLEQERLLEDNNTPHAAVNAASDDDVKVPLSFEEDRVPADRYYLVYLILLIHGIGVLMPWNMFITANDYFVNYKLKPIPTGNDTTEEVEQTVYQDYFLRSLCFVAQVPSVLLNGINLFSKGKSGSSSIRIIASILTIIGVFFFTVLLAIIDSSAWPAAFFWITMISVVIINSANGIYQNSVYGLAACLPMKYTNAVLIGSNVSGVMTTLIAMLTMIAAPDVRTSAILFFITAIVVLFVAFGTFFALNKTPFYTYHAKKSAELTPVKEEGATAEGYLMQYWTVFKLCWKEDFGVFFVFFVTICCFPAIQAEVRPVSSNFFISETFFTMITCFLTFNLFAVIGSTLTSFFQKPSPDWAWLPIVLRVLFIPFFMLCNVKPLSRRLPVVVTCDYLYWLGGVLMALTSGYFSSLSMMYAPRRVQPDQKGTAGMMAAFSLVLGIFFGIIFAFPVIAFVENVGSYQHHSHLNPFTDSHLDDSSILEYSSLSPLSFNNSTF